MGSIGLVVGSLLMARLADRLHEGQWLALSFVGMGLAEIVFTQAPAVRLAIALYTANGFLNAPSIIGSQLVIQRRTPRELRGRVNSAFFVTRHVAFAIGMASAGLADVFDVRVLFLIAGVVVLGCGLLTLALPGLGQPSAEWRRVLAMLRAAPAAPGLGLGRAALLADIDQLAIHLPALAGLSRQGRQELASRRGSTRRQPAQRSCGRARLATRPTSCSTGGPSRAARRMAPSGCWRYITPAISSARSPY